MRRSICITEPKVALAGKAGTWKFTYIPSTTIPAKATMLFDVISLGREFDWEIPQAGTRKKANLIWMMMPNGKSVAAKLVDSDQEISSEFEFTLPAEVKAGEELSIFIGSPDEATNEKNGTTAQCFIQRRRPFYLYIDPKGKGDYKEPETFQVDVRGSELDYIRIITPSIVSKNQRFDVIVRFEDAYGNLTGMCPEDSLIELTYEGLRDNLSWKLFIPETGFITLPNLYFNEPGIYKFRLTNLKTGDVYFSSPIKCFLETDKLVYWGLLHGESERFDAVENIESALRHFRDDKAYQFFGTSPFEWENETSNDEWKHIGNNVADFNEADRFVTFLGFQWEGEKGKEGMRNILYSKDSKQLLRQKDNKSSTLEKLYKNFTPKELVSIPSLSMGKGHSFDFKEYYPEFEPVVEIYNCWGSSECTEKEGNTKPIKSLGKKPLSEVKEGSVRDALNKGLRFGFVAGGLDDRGIYSKLFHSDQIQYSSGLTAILAPEQSREAMITALQNRSCYATTGPRIILHFQLAGLSMGAQTSSEKKPGLVYNRHLEIFAAGSDDLKEVQVIRNGEILHTFKPKGYSCNETLDDSDPLDKVCLEHHQTKQAFTYYYIKVIQKDDQIAWSSPIWVDLSSEESAPPKKGRS
ncbi:MAG: DUF3604 domain-containing protein [Simkaniaceae bacterium]|nr:DUF3604 domain-containing protein [Simkaniaceae bacterium]